MQWLFGFAVMVGMLVLRLLVPVALTLVAVTLLRRLDARLHQSAST